MADYFVDFREDLKSKILDPNQIYFSTSVSKSWLPRVTEVGMASQEGPQATRAEGGAEAPLLNAWAARLLPWPAG